MSQEYKKQTFIQKVRNYIVDCLEHRVDSDTLIQFNTAMEKYLKKSFKNGARAGYIKACKKAEKSGAETA